MVFSTPSARQTDTSEPVVCVCCVVCVLKAYL